MKKHNIRSIIFECIEIALIALLPVLITYHFLARPFIVQGASMEPNFQNGNYLIVDILSSRRGLIERGDIIVFRYPQDPSLYHIKRVIGLPGDRVSILNRRVFINGDIITEEYIPSYVFTDPISYTDLQLMDDQYFIMGDNRSSSLDSRAWGPLDKDNIIGIVRLRIFPSLSIF